jgi:hypothetical protein
VGYWFKKYKGEISKVLKKKYSTRRKIHTERRYFIDFENSNNLYLEPRSIGLFMSARNLAWKESEIYRAVFTVKGLRINYFVSNYTLRFIVSRSSKHLNGFVLSPVTVTGVPYAFPIRDNEILTMISDDFIITKYFLNSFYYISLCDTLCT